MSDALSFEVDGVRLRADGYGDPASRPVLLAHGGGQTRHSWHGAACELQRRGWYALTLDLRGHGDSDWSDAGAYDLADFAADVRAVAASFSRPPAIVGASLGGIAAMVAIGEAPQAEVASALVLVDVAPNIEPAGAARIRAFMTANPDGFASLEEVADAVAAYNPHRPRPQRLDGLRKNVRRRDDGRWYWHWDPRFMVGDLDETRLAHNERRLEAAARAISVPTLLVRGADSDLLSRDGAERLRALVPHARHVDIARAGHMVAGDRNDAFTAAIVDFLAVVAPPDGGESAPSGGVRMA